MTTADDILNAFEDNNNDNSKAEAKQLTTDIHLNISRIQGILNQTVKLVEQLKTIHQ